MGYNYQKICQDLLSGLPSRQEEVLIRRFGLKKDQETLEAIGKDFKITRERVRQIEKDGLERTKPKIKNYPLLFQYFKKYFQKFGDLRREEAIFNEIGSLENKNQIYFLLTLGSDFERFSESEDFYPLWAINEKSVERAKKTVNSVYQKLGKLRKPISSRELLVLLKPDFSWLAQAIFDSYLDISKKIQKSEEGLFGLKDWPEVNPRGVKDKLYLVLKRENKPLHFEELAKLVKGSLVQTVHNELIRDQRFVLVGRGIYALREWGYYPGQVKEVIFKILTEERKALTKKEILEKVLAQRLVKENTVFLNLSNKKYFLRDSQGKFFANEV